MSNENDTLPSDPLRVSAVAFLNGRVLYHSLVDPKVPADKAPRLPDGRPMFDVRERLPSACAADLENGDADLALVPVASYAAHPEWEVVPEIGIGCRGAVNTVVVAAERALEDLDTITLDGASRTSVLLLKLLLHMKGLRPDLVAVEHGAGEAMVQGATGSLIIGDAAFGIADRFAHVIDLGEEWFTLTGLPFVFAFWAARPGVLKPGHVEALQWARDRSLGKYAETIAHEYREEVLARGEAALPENDYANYLRRTIRYSLDTNQREGLVDFLDRARSAGLVQIPGLHPEEEVHVHFAGRGAPEALLAARRRSAPMDVESLLSRAARGERLDLAEGIYLLEKAPLMQLGEAADARRRALHPEPVVTYIIDRNVNYTNVCVTRCKFCNFYKPPTAKDGKYVLTRDEFTRKFRETEELGGVQILLQGGLNPELPLSWYEDLFRWTKDNFRLRLHALSPTEILHLSQIEDLSVREVLQRLQAAGMDSLPGGGAEILDDEIRNRISPFKNNTQEWLGVMREAHRLGMRSTATMVFGFQETSEHILLHLLRLRGLQDETGGFTAFITWPFQAEGTRLKLRDDTSALRYLRVQALARLFLDNVPNIQVSWPTLGPEIGEVALRFGANDFGSVMIEENVVATAGAHFMMSADQIEKHIEYAGFEPRRRTMDYTLLDHAASAE